MRRPLPDGGKRMGRYIIAIGMGVWATSQLYAQTTTAQPMPRENVAATVNGDVIRIDELDVAFKRIVPLDTPLTSAQSKRLRAEILDELIDERLMTQFLAQHGPPIPPADIERTMQGLIASLRKQKKTLAEHLREIGQTEQQVREQWTRILQLQKLIDARSTEEELRKYFDTHREVFEQTKVRVSHIVIRLGRTATPSERTSAHDKLTQIRNSILKGDLDFATAAKKYSVCPSAREGGDLGFITRNDPMVDEAFAAAAFAVKTGEISEPVESDLGIHLIRPTERKAGTPITFEKAQDRVRELFADDIRRSMLEKLRKDATIQIALP